MFDPFDDARRRVRLSLEDLSRWLALGEKAAQIGAYNSQQVLNRAADSIGAVRKALHEFSDFDGEGIYEEFVRAIDWSLDELDVLGVAKDREYSSSEAREVLREIPDDVRRSVIEHGKTILRNEKDNELQSEARGEVERALKNGVFIEFVRRNPGKGAWHTFPIYSTDVVYDSIEGYEQSWTECQTWVYHNDLWVVASTYHHAETDNCSTSYEEIPSSVAAAKLIASEVELNVEDLIWLKRLADQQPKPIVIPKSQILWNRELGELTIGDKLARRVPRPKQAKNVTKILDAFQEEGWPVRIDSPFEGNEDGRTKLRETISQVNIQLTGIRFEADGTGEGVRYRLIEDARTPDEVLKSDDGIGF